ncbi:MAG: DUF4249 domain-containing protein [Chitinophagaceae bacterium]
MRRIFFSIISLELLVTAGCRDQYLPDIVAEAPNYLVIEAVLNAGEGETNVHITRTTQIARTSAITGEDNALVTVEGKDNSSVSLSYAGNGVYFHPNLDLIIGNEYRLRVRTSNGKEYLSAFVVAKTTPPIDSITLGRRIDKGMNVEVNSHDNTGNTRYYRWEYEETWEIHSHYYSRYIYENKKVRKRVLPQEDVSVCWRHNNSTRIALGSTAKLAADVISKIPILSFPFGDDRLSVRYSILVRQYALEKEAYEYYDLLRKNTESLGTIFDAQPSENKGNITCVNDPKEPVIGFVTASTIEKKRFFVLASEVPDWRFQEYCYSQLVTLRPDSTEFYFGTGGYKPYDTIEIDPVRSNPPAYLGAFDYCVDCTDRGGSTIRPSFW